MRCSIRQTHRQVKEPAGGLYALGTDGRIAQLDREITLGNGPCFSPDDRTLYHADSMRQTVFAYDYYLATGGVSNRRVFFDSTAYGPIPDGATVDAAGEKHLVGYLVPDHGADLDELVDEAEDDVVDRWHEVYGELSFPVEVRAGETAVIDVKYSVEPPG